MRERVLRPVISAVGLVTAVHPQARSAGEAERHDAPEITGVCVCVCVCVRARARVCGVCVLFVYIGGP